MVTGRVIKRYREDKKVNKVKKVREKGSEKNTLKDLLWPSRLPM